MTKLKPKPLASEEEVCVGGEGPVTVSVGSGPGDLVLREPRAVSYGCGLRAGLVREPLSLSVS